MDPDAYERLCGAVEAEFGTTPQFRNEYEVQGMAAPSGVIMLVQMEGESAAVAVPESVGDDEVERMIELLAVELRDEAQ